MSVRATARASAGVPQSLPPSLYAATARPGPATPPLDGGSELARRLHRAPEHALCMPTSPIRPIRVHGLWRMGVLAKVLEGRIRDRLCGS